MSSLIENAAERLERRVAPTSPIRKDVNVSFEFFPPATPKGLDLTYRTIKHDRTVIHRDGPIHVAQRKVGVVNADPPGCTETETPLSATTSPCLTVRSATASGR